MHFQRTYSQSGKWERTEHENPRGLRLSRMKEGDTGGLKRWLLFRSTCSLRLSWLLVWVWITLYIFLPPNSSIWGFKSYFTFIALYFLSQYGNTAVIRTGITHYKKIMNAPECLMYLSYYKVLKLSIKKKKKALYSWQVILALHDLAPVPINRQSM